MRLILATISAALLFVGCGANEPKQPTITVDPTTAIKINTTIPFKEGAVIAANIKNDCNLGTKLSEFIHDYAVGEGIGVIRKSLVDKNDKGKTLIVEITNSVSQGNAFIGHRKYTSIEGTLYNGGKKLAQFTAARVSSGGAFAGFKGSCSVLGRTVKTLGSDISRWLESPMDGAHLGDHM